MNERFKLLRQTLGLKLREIAERLGVQPSAVSGWERGFYPLPRARIYQLCKEYNVRREWLERGEGEMFEPEAKPKTEDEALEDAVVALFESLDSVAQEAVLRVLTRYVDEARKAKTRGETPEDSEAFTPILVAANLSNDDFTA